MVLANIAENVNKNPKTTIGIVIFITFLMISLLRRAARFVPMLPRVS